MKHVKIFWLFPIFMIGFLFNSCRKEDVRDPENPSEKSIREASSSTSGNEYTMFPNAIFVKNDINTNIVSLTATEITINKISRLDDIIEGDVLYSLPTDKFPNGYVVKLSNKRVEGNMVKYNVSEVGFGEVFKKAKITNNLAFTDLSKVVIYDPVSSASSGKMGSTAATPIKALDPARFIVKPKLDGNSVYFEYIFWDQDGKLTETKYDQVIAKVKLTADVSALDFSWEGLTLPGKKALYIKANPRFSVNVTMSYNFNGSTDPLIAKSLKEEYNKIVVGKRIALGDGFSLSPRFASDFMISPKVIPYVKFSASGSAEMELTTKYENFGADIYISSNDALNLSSYNKDKYTGVYGKVGVEYKADVEGSITFAPGIGFENQLFGNFEWLNFLSNKEARAYIGVYSDWNTTITLKNTANNQTNGQFCDVFSANTVCGLDLYSEGNLSFLGKEIYNLPKETIWSNNVLGNLIPQFTYNTCTAEPKLVDSEGYKYKVVKIGDQWWSAENWRVGGLLYNNDKLYGSYGWASNIPKGWRISTRQDYEKMLQILGNNAYSFMISNAGFNAKPYGFYTKATSPNYGVNMDGINDFNKKAVFSMGQELNLCNGCGNYPIDCLVVDYTNFTCSIQRLSSSIWGGMYNAQWFYNVRLIKE